MATLKKQDLFIVVRCSHLDGFDPIDEIDAVLTKKKYAWFGKYGEPLNRQISAMLEESDRQIFVVLVEKTKGPEHYKFKPYRLTLASKAEPEKKTDYPAYYRSFIGRIGQWLRLSEYDGPKIELKSLVVRSSAQSLPKSLSSSMRGHFVCRLGP